VAFGAIPAPAPGARVAGTMSELDRLRAGDPEAWARLFEATHRAVYRAALVQVRDPHLAEDVMAQVYLEAFAGIRRYRDRGRPFAAWLLTIARQRAVDALRKRQRELRRLSTQTPPAADEEVQLTESSVLLGALETLTPEQREVLHLRFVEDLSLEQTAAVMGRSVGAVKALQHRAILRLRAALTHHSGGNRA